MTAECGGSVEVPGAASAALNQVPVPEDAQVRESVVAEAEAKRIADEEGRMEVEAEAKRKAEEDARKKAEAEAKRIADEGARIKAAAVAKQKAEELQWVRKNLLLIQQIQISNEFKN